MHRMSTLDYNLGPHLVSPSNHMLKVAVDIFSHVHFVLQWHLLTVPLSILLLSE